MKLIKADKQWWNADKLRRVDHYRGICDNCGTDVECDEPIEVLEMLENEKALYYLVLGIYTCPECNAYLKVIRHFKSMDITAELQELQIKHDPA